MLPPGQNLHTFHLSENRWGIDEYHFTTQGFTSHHFPVREGELKRMSVPFRYVFPEELDLRAKTAGMSRVGRWAGWQHEPFTDDSPEVGARKYFADLVIVYDGQGFDKDVDDLPVQLRIGANRLVQLAKSLGYVQKGDPNFDIDEFIDAVESTVQRILDAPLAFPEVHSSIRRAILRRFPYGVYFAY